MISNLLGLKADKLALMMVLMALMVFPLGLSAQRMTADQFMAVIQEKQQKIDVIQEGAKYAWYYFDLDNAEAKARQTSDYQAYMDFILARYDRTLSIMNYAAARIAGEIAEFIRQHRYDGLFSDDVMSEGIAKYIDMQSFFNKWGYESEEKFRRNWSNFTAKYGDNGSAFFQEDNDYMRRYGVYVDN